jgi:hypothetical protein
MMLLTAWSHSSASLPLARRLSLARRDLVPGGVGCASPCVRSAATSHSRGAESPTIGPTQPEAIQRFRHADSREASNELACRGGTDRIAEAAPGSPLSLLVTARPA